MISGFLAKTSKFAIFEVGKSEFSWLWVPNNLQKNGTAIFILCLQELFTKVKMKNKQGFL